MIALSETWAPKDSKNAQNIGSVSGYQPYFGSKQSTLKSGPGFLTRKELKYVQRKELDITFKGEDNEFQSCWIEIQNEHCLNTLIGTYYRHPKKSSNNV